MVADLLGLWLALGVAMALAGNRTEAFQDTLWILPTLPFWVLLFWTYRLYGRAIKRLEPTHIEDTPSLFHALVLGTLCLWLFYRFVAPVPQLALGEVLVFGLLALPLIAGLRAILRAINLRSQGPERVFAIGLPEDVRLLRRKLGNHPAFEMALVGAVTSKACEELGLELSVDIDEVEVVLASGQIDHLMVRLDAGYLPQERAEELLHACHREGIRFSCFPGAKGLIPPGVEVNHLEGWGFLTSSPPVLSRTARTMKRYLDLVASALLLVLLAPVTALIALAIKLDSEGPVLFSQIRVGLDGRCFRLNKFRTMVEGAEEMTAELMDRSVDPNWLDIEDDPRVTRVGRFLRNTSLDELPELWNVLKGEMSLVGPRPLSELDDKNVHGRRRHRLDLVPGITGYWQVVGRTSIPFDEMLEIDYDYVAGWSLWRDIEILLRTVPAVLRRRGAN